jgi:hypothetical protein
MNRRFIINSLIFIFIILIVNNADSFQAGTGNGKSTYLEIKIQSRPEYDKSAGESMITLFSSKDSTKLKEYKLDGIWHYIAYSQQEKKYIIGGLFQVGAWLPMCEIRYIEESTYAMKPSSLNKTDWFSFIAEPDKSGKYIAFIGKYDEKYMVLYVLNTVTDRIQITGKPPLPPPADSSYYSDEMLKEQWNWGNEYSDGFTEMDKGIIVFDKYDKLKVSFGKDNALSRSSKRKNVFYKLLK